MPFRVAHTLHFKSPVGSAAALFYLQSLHSQAFMAYKYNLETDNITGKPFHEWCTYMEGSHLFLQFMQSQRAGSFLMYLEALGSIIPWMFAMDHFHYA